jgi:hypothetical protein
MPTKTKVVDLLFGWAMAASAIGFFVWYLWVKVAAIVVSL